MSFDEFNQFQRMEDPAEREAEELKSRKASRSGFKKKSSSRSVSIGTFRFGTGFASLLVWLIFLAAVGFGTYLVVQKFMQAG